MTREDMTPLVRRPQLRSWRDHLSGASLVTRDADGEIIYASLPAFAEVFAAKGALSSGFAIAAFTRGSLKSA
jgi:hypothetical protein